MISFDNEPWLTMETRDFSIGRSLYAKRRITPGTEILCDYPLFQFGVESGESSGVPMDAQLRSTISAFIDKVNPDMDNRVADFAIPDHYLDHALVQKYRNLVDELISNDSSVCDRRVGLMNFLLACYTNAHQTMDPVTGKTLCGLYEKASKMAHSCAPNCAFFIRPETMELVVRALCVIEEGELITISYLDELQLLLPVFLRREITWRTKFFECQCLRCIEEAKVSANAEHQFEIYSHLQQYIETCSIQLPEIANDVEWYHDGLKYLVEALSNYREWKSVPDNMARYTPFPRQTLANSLLFYNYVVSTMSEHHPVLVTRWILQGIPWIPDLIPIMEWLDFESDFPGRSDDTQLLTKGQLMSPKVPLLWSDIENLIGDLMVRVWAGVKVAVRSGFFDQKRYRDELIYLDSLRRSRTN